MQAQRFGEAIQQLSWEAHFTPGLLGDEEVQDRIGHVGAHIREFRYAACRQDGMQAPE